MQFSPSIITKNVELKAPTDKVAVFLPILTINSVFSQVNPV